LHLQEEFGPSLDIEPTDGWRLPSPQLDARNMLNEAKVIPVLGGLDVCPRGGDE
jgi:hypothetical protein